VAKAAAAAGAAGAAAAAAAAAKMDAAPSGAPDAVDASVPDAALDEGVAAASGSDSEPVEEAPDAALDEAAPAGAAASAQVANPGDAAPAGDPGLEPTALGIPAVRVPAPAKPVPDKPVPDKAVPDKAGASGGKSGAASAASSPAAGPTDTDQYAKTSLTSSSAILAAAESRSAAASSAGSASAAGSGSPAGSASAAVSGAAVHDVTVKAGTPAPASSPPVSAAPPGAVSPEPTVKVSHPPAKPSATVKAATPQAPAAAKPAPPPQPSDKDAWWSNAYQQQGPSFSPSQSRPAVPYPSAQPGPASAFSQPTQYTPPNTPPTRPAGPATTPHQPYNYDHQYPAGSGSQPPRKGGAGKKILLGILAVIVVAAVAVAATILGSRHGSTPNAVNSSSPAASGGPSTSPANSAPAGPVPPVTSSTPTVVRAIDDHSDTMPSGYTPYALHPSAAGTKAGFMIDVPAGWRVDQQTPQRIFFNDPDGVSNVEIDLTPHTRPDMVAEAQFIKRQTLAQGKFPQYKEIELGPENVLGTRGALWRFDWTDPKTGTQLRVDDMLFILQTPNGPQSYAIFMTAPEGNAPGSWSVTVLPIIAKMLQSFKETTS
jgi:hypothetical protein